ncbi:DUF4397 domain-containing protein [Risungbinella massiliensis]|uniref:DUF4397 domain-containing protein n=1 Tax=Risungbinella massiliensis TaxID=1329796 RepID=UPI0005CC8182|nr:DUF4397 domain-containing protein [Risungbinella massiliensis]
MNWKKFLSVVMAAIAFLSFSGFVSAKTPNAKVRFLHASPNAPTVDVYIDGKKVVDNVPYAGVTTYSDITAGDHKVEIYPVGTKEKALLSKNVKTDAGQRYTISIVGRVDDPNNDLLLDLLVASDQPTHLPGKAQLRTVYTSPDAPAISVWEKNGPVLFERVGFKEISNYRAMEPKTYNLEIRLVNSETTLLEIPNLPLKDQDEVTLYVLDVKGDPKLQVIALNEKGEVLRTLPTLGQVAGEALPKKND